MELGLCSPCADSTNTQHVSQELRRDGVEHLAGKRHAPLGQVSEKLSRDTQTLVDFEGVVNVWVVDEALPSDSCARLLQVRAHDDEQVILVLLLQGQQAIAVFEGGFGVVDRTWAYDDKQPAIGIFALYNSDSFVASLDDSFS